MEKIELTREDVQLIINAFSGLYAFCQSRNCRVVDLEKVISMFEKKLDYKELSIFTDSK